jgi:membrane-associated phospholipid phosphatase
LHHYQTSSGPLARSFDRKVFGYVAASLVVLPFLVLYIDGPAKSFVVSVQSDWGLQVATVITTMGYGLADAAIAGTLFVIGLMAGKPREALAGRLGLFAVIISGLFGQLFKHLFCRARPLTEKSGEFFSEFPCLGKGAGFISFPSGHSITAFALAFVLARVYPRYAVLFYGLAVLVALSRVYLAKHFPSDVVAGAVVGILAGWIVCRFVALSPVHGHT